VNEFFSSRQPLSAAKGAVLTITMRWTDRLVGIISTLILARLLAPADFGIVAMASLVVALTETLLDLGVGSALIQDRTAGREEFNTAWTLGLLQALLAALLIALIGAPLAAEYFNDSRVTDVLRVMAVSVFIGGLQNIGIVTFQKNMEFNKDFRFFFLRRISGFVITVCLAFWLRSYWAMILGTLATRAIGVALSYAMHDFRPRLSFVSIANLWAFSQWILVRNLGNYGATQIDKFVLGRRVDAAALGAYSLADEISSMPTGELLAPLGRVLFPAFVRAAGQGEELRRVFCLAFGVQVLLALPAGVGLALVAPVAVPLLLGAQWLMAIPLVQILSLMSIGGALAHGSGYLLLTLGKVRLLAIVSWVQFALLSSLLLFVFPNSNAEEIAGIRLTVSFAGMAVVLGFVLREMRSIRLLDLISNTWRPAVATALMTALLYFTKPPTHFSLVVQLLGQIALGAIAYGATVLAFWRLSGCPEGAESYLLDKMHIRERVTRLLGYSSPSARQS